MKKLLYIAAFSLVWLICTSCTKKVYVPVTSTVTDIQYKDKVRYDTTYLFDSIHIKEKGDTITIYRYRDRWRDRYMYDTVYMCKIDTIREPYPLEKELTRLQRLQMNFGTASFFAVMLFISYWFIRKKFF